MYTNNLLESINDVTSNSCVTSKKMMEAINIWLELFGGNAPWLKDNKLTLGLPSLIAQEVAMETTLEFEMHITGSDMADYLEKQIQPVLRNLRTDVEYACASGGLTFKPCINGKDISIETIQSNSFYPIDFNNSREITGAFFIYRKWIGKDVYTRIETHKLEGTNYRITNKAYVTRNEDSIGTECPLDSVEEWANIAPETVLQNIEHPLFVYFRIPGGNTVDMDSPLGCSIYAKAVQDGLIEEADKQYQRLSWEYEGGELAIDASEDAFRKVDGLPLLPEGKERLYRTNNLDATTTNGTDLFKAWTPSLRDSNYIEGLNRILIQIENACSLARGTISDPTEVEKTATEIKIAKQRSWALIKDIQNSLEDALERLVYANYVIAKLYGVVPDGEYNTSYQWDDSIIVDAEAERLRDQQEVSLGLMLPYEYRMKWYGEDETTAKLKMEDINSLSNSDILGFSSYEKPKETTAEPTVQEE